MAKRVTKKTNTNELDGKEFFAAIAQIEQIAAAENVASAPLAAFATASTVAPAVEEPTAPAVEEPAVEEPADPAEEKPEDGSAN